MQSLPTRAIYTAIELQCHCVIMFINSNAPIYTQPTYLPSSYIPMFLLKVFLYLSPYLISHNPTVEPLHSSLKMKGVSTLAAGYHNSHQLDKYDLADFERFSEQCGGLSSLNHIVWFPHDVGK